MSAFILDENHIRVIISYAIENGARISHPTTYGLWVDVTPEHGQILVDENYASVNYRYDKNNEPYTYQHKPVHKNFVQVIKAVDCYVYQSCEHPQFYRSQAYEIVQAIKEQAFRKMLNDNYKEEYDRAKWSIE